MIRSLLMGVVAGMRSITPFAAVSMAARRERLPARNGAPGFLARPLVSKAGLLLAAGELLGDKWSRAPDRIVLAGMIARISTGALAGAALAPREDRVVAAMVGAAAAVVSSHLTFHARMKAMRRYGQVRTGLVEDAIAVGSALLLANVTRGQSR